VAVRRSLASGSAKLSGLGISHTVPKRKTESGFMVLLRRSLEFANEVKIGLSEFSVLRAGVD
jgi:hypothetical protein